MFATDGACNHCYERRNHRLGEHFLLHNHLAPVVEFTFVPEGAMRQMIFTCSRAHGQLLGVSFIMCSSLISSCFRGFSFRMCHFLYYLSVNSFFNSSHLGSVSSSFLSFSLISLTCKSFNFSKASDCNVPSFTPG